MSAQAQGDGDCFPVAFNLVLDGDDTMRLCHGTVVRPSDGLHHSHAWVETHNVYDCPMPDGTTVPVLVELAIDHSNGNDVTMPAALYRKLGWVHDVTEYTAHEARLHALRTKHFGPWAP